MNEATYKKIGAEFDRLWEEFYPNKEMDFRPAWHAFLETQGITDDEWVSELDRRLDEKAKREEYPEHLEAEAEGETWVSKDFRQHLSSLSSEQLIVLLDRMMNEDTYRKLGDEFDRLVGVHDPLTSEENRQAFRTAWLDFLSGTNITDDQWDDELLRRIDEKAKRVAFGCGGAGPHSGLELRKLPAGGDSNMILCNGCFEHEIKWRKEQNDTVENKFELPSWEDLEVYDG